MTTIFSPEVKAYIKALVDEAPPLSREQRSKLYTLWNGGSITPVPPEVRKREQDKAKSLALSRKIQAFTLACAICEVPSSVHDDIEAFTHEYEPRSPQEIQNYVNKVMEK